MQKLADNKAIDKPVFTFHLDVSNANSWIQFGDPGSGIVYANISKDAPLWIVGAYDMNIANL